MDLAGSARVFAANALWRATGLRPAGRVLVRALESPDETTRSVAAMFLTQGGARAEPLLREALAQRVNLPLVLEIIASLRDPRYAPALHPLTQDPDPQVAAAAREALRAVEG